MKSVEGLSTDLGWEARPAMGGTWATGSTPAASFTVAGWGGDTQRQQGSCLSVPAVIPPSNIATPFLYNCCLQPQCTKSKHVVLTLREGGMSAAWSLETLRARGSGLATASLGVM